MLAEINKEQHKMRSDEGSIIGEFPKNVLEHINNLSKCERRSEEKEWSSRELNNMVSDAMEEYIKEHKKEANSYLGLGQVIDCPVTINLYQQPVFNFYSPPAQVGGALNCMIDFEGQTAVVQIGENRKIFRVRGKLALIALSNEGETGGKRRSMRMWGNKKNGSDKGRCNLMYPDSGECGEVRDLTELLGVNNNGGREMVTTDFELSGGRSIKLTMNQIPNRFPNNPGNLDGLIEGIQMNDHLLSLLKDKDQPPSRHYLTKLPVKRKFTQEEEEHEQHKVQTKQETSNDLTKVENIEVIENEQLHSDIIENTKVTKMEPCTKLSYLLKFVRGIKVGNYSSMNAFCFENNLPQSTFRYWLADARIMHSNPELCEFIKDRIVQRRNDPFYEEKIRKGYPKINSFATFDRTNI